MKTEKIVNGSDMWLSKVFEFVLFGKWIIDDLHDPEKFLPRSPGGPEVLI